MCLSVECEFRELGFLDCAAPFHTADDATCRVFSSQIASQTRSQEAHPANQGQFRGFGIQRRRPALGDGLGDTGAGQLE